MAKKSEVRSIRLDTETQRRLDALCAKHNLNANDLIRLGLEFVLPMAEQSPLKVRILLVAE